MFLTDGFEETEFNKIFNDGKTAHTTMCLRDCAHVLRDKFSFLSESDDLFFRPIRNSLRTDGTTFQTEPMQSAYFHVI